MKSNRLKTLESGIVTPSLSAWYFPVSISSKKGGAARFCVDHKTVNVVMRANNWSLHRIEELFGHLSSVQCFTKLDLFYGYWQVRMAKVVNRVTKFICTFGTYQFEQMPFGIVIAPSAFKRLIDQLFRDVPFVISYLEDILGFLETFEAHVYHVTFVLKVVYNHINVFVLYASGRDTCTHI